MLEERESLASNWVNSPSKNEAGFYALHYAAFHGNINMIRLLQQHGASFTAITQQGINIMHVAAQGDCPLALAYFRDHGLSVDSRDLKDNTPLHWTAFSGSDLAVSYLLA